MTTEHLEFLMEVFERIARGPVNVDRLRSVIAFIEDVLWPSPSMKDYADYSHTSQWVEAGNDSHFCATFRGEGFELEIAGGAYMASMGLKDSIRPENNWMVVIGGED